MCFYELLSELLYAYLFSFGQNSNCPCSIKLTNKHCLNYSVRIMFGSPCWCIQCVRILLPEFSNLLYLLWQKLRKQGSVWFYSTLNHIEEKENIVPYTSQLPAVEVMLRVLEGRGLFVGELIPTGCFWLNLFFSVTTRLCLLETKKKLTKDCLKKKKRSTIKYFEWKLHQHTCSSTFIPSTCVNCAKNK